MKYMAVVNCKSCGKIFNYDGHKVCPACRKAEDELFTKVKEYLYAHPGSSAQEVADATEVSVDKIISYLKQGRLETTGDNMILQCEKCGAAIASGRYCDKCTAELQRNLQGAADSMKTKIQSSTPTKPKGNDGNKMFTADRRK